MHHFSASVTQRTAAALNAEAAAHRLRAALVQVRSEPLLNTQAVGTPSSRHMFVPAALVGKPRPPAPTPSSSLFATPFTLPPFPDTLTPRAPPAGSQRRAAGHEPKHAKAVTIKRESVSPAPAASTFDWGPLPKVGPKTTLAADLRTPSRP
jgi:nucleoporin NUP159